MSLGRGQNNNEENSLIKPSAVTYYSHDKENSKRTESLELTDVSSGSNGETATSANVQ